MTQALCTSFKVELLQAKHNFSVGGHLFKCALYTGQAVLGAETTAYSSVNEVVSAQYLPGGFWLTNVNPSAADATAMQTFAENPSWDNVSFTTSQALIYNSSAANKAVAVLDFGGSCTVLKGTFTINLPPVTPTTALLRII